MIDIDDTFFTPDELRMWLHNARTDASRNSYAWMLARVLKFVQNHHPDLFVDDMDDGDMYGAHDATGIV